MNNLLRPRYVISNLQENDWLFVGFVVLLLWFLPVVLAVATNLHTFDGISNGDLIGGDVFFEIVEPEELGYTYRIRPAKDFGTTFNDSFIGEGIPLVPVDPPYGCGWPNNAEELEGNVALVERGECSFLSKSVRAEEAGARAVIVTDSEGKSDNFFVEMIDDKTLREVNIPAGFLVGKNGHMIRKTLERMNKRYARINIPVNLTFAIQRKINQPPWIGW